MTPAHLEQVPGTGTETLAELNVESRISLAFTAHPEAVAALLPPGWQSNAFAAGPSRGANLLLILSDRQLVQDGNGAPLPGQAINLLAVAAVPARHAETGAQGVMIVHGLSAQPEGAPGPYDVFSAAEATAERTLRAGAGDTRTGDEQWHFAGADGTVLELRMRHTRGVPVRSQTETRAYSRIRPDFSRIYRADQGSFVLRSSVDGTDSVADWRFRATGPQLGTLFDGSEQLVSVTAIPWLVRQVFLPALDAQEIPCR